MIEAYLLSFYSSRFLYNLIKISFLIFYLLIYRSTIYSNGSNITLSKLNIKYPGKGGRDKFLTRNYDLSTPITEARGRFFF